MADTLAVLITYYNEGSLLTECLDSIFSQSVLPDEVLVYDDASNIPAADHIPLGWPVRVIRSEENRGPAYGRNCLMQECTCEYIHFQDADDLFKPDWCQKIRAAIATTGADIILTEITSVRDGRTVTERVLGLDRLLPVYGLVCFALAGSILVPTTTFRKNIGLSIGGFRTREILSQSEDFDFHIPLAATGATYTSILEPLIIQRLRTDSHSSSNITACWTSALKAVELFEAELPKKYRSNLASAASRIGSHLFAAGETGLARVAFRLSRRLGEVDHSERGGIYSLIALFLGQYSAEVAGRCYRCIVPECLRKKI